MSRYEDMRALLGEVSEIRRSLEKEYDAARGNPDVKEVLRIKVKSALEHLRSVLEYSAHELRGKYCGDLQPDDRVYFPYARTKSRFEKCREKNLPGLATASPGAANVIASIQPFSCGDNWLISLCDQVNLNKHQSLEKQVRVNSVSSSYTVGRLLKIGGTGTVVTLDRAVYNGVPINGGKALTFTSGMSDEEITAQLGDDALRLPVSREFDWVEFRFASSAEDTLKLIGKAHDEICRYTDEVKLYF